MKTTIAVLAAFLLLASMPSISVYAYDGYASRGYDYPGQRWDLQHYEVNYRYGYASGYERYAPGTWASGQSAYDTWPSQWGITPRNNAYYTIGYHGGNQHPTRYYPPVTHSRYIPAWKYPLYY